jgi:hypothetical protein
MEEFGSEQRHGRPYFYCHRLQRSERSPRMIGKSRVDRMSMDSVLTEKTKVYCAQRCRHDIDPKDILILRCLALGSSKYEQQSTWIINTLRGFMIRETTLRRGEHIKCVTRINGKKVCNACYAVAIGYSRSKLMNFIAEIRNTGRYTSVHGNTHRRREKNKVTVARALFEQYVKDFGEPMPHRQTRRLKDGALVQTICLPMNVRRAEIWLTINSQLRRLGEASIGLPTFHRLWKPEFTYIHIPKSSRFSKCNICWEYKNYRQSAPDEATKERISRAYQLHLDMSLEDRMEYSRGRTAAINEPDQYLSLIIDGMDQNTIWVPKFKQSVKGIESHYIKTHLCGVLVHGIGLYCHVWIDAHHKHDSNQVVTSIMKVLQDVKRRKNRLPPYL